MERRHAIDQTRNSITAASLSALSRRQRADLSGRTDGVIGVLFAGKWCGPCEEFVQLLRRCYAQVRDSGEQFEVVFVSADKDREDFEHLSADMPWWRIDFDDFPSLNKMRCLFKIQDIPCLSLVDMASGQTIISNACDLVREHPDGRGFPWRPRSYEQLMVDGLLDKDGQLCDYSRIQGAFKALYFAANWCPPCKAFTPELREMAGRICSRGLKFEVILVSSDRTAESFEQHRGAAPWLAVPYAQAGRRRELAERFGVQGIPSLLVLDQHDRLVCRNARAHVAEDPLAQC
ncbi:nucleoredoxin-like [Pollicipes pollicipes]|uniref:nucleoredoxin-like n=1 Tax=Pollicipes pollicipes TaxID=41117 RepID=UPI001884F55C|nr:nucleoredoxin-like [Pollicipes pollicipes]